MKKIIVFIFVTTFLLATDLNLLLQNMKKEFNIKEEPKIEKKVLQQEKVIKKEEIKPTITKEQKELLSLEKELLKMKKELLQLDTEIKKEEEVKKVETKPKKEVKKVEKVIQKPKKKKKLTPIEKKLLKIKKRYEPKKEVKKEVKKVEKVEKAIKKPKKKRKLTSIEKKLLKLKKKYISKKKKKKKKIEVIKVEDKDINNLTPLEKELLEVKKEFNLINRTLTPVEKKLYSIKKKYNVKDKSSKPTELELRLAEIRKKYHLKDKLPKQKVLFGNALDEVQEALTFDFGVMKSIKKERKSIDKSIRSVKEKLHLVKKKKKKKKKETLLESVQNFSLTETLEIKEGESYGLPSILGFNKKEKPKTFLGSKYLGSTVEDFKDVGGSFYKGFKYSGESAEFISGMMYMNSKMYNGMFGLFSDSPLNIFEEEEKETSIFDIIGVGNSVLDFFN